MFESFIFPRFPDPQDYTKAFPLEKMLETERQIDELMRFNRVEKAAKLSVELLENTKQASRDAFMKDVTLIHYFLADFAKTNMWIAIYFHWKLVGNNNRNYVFLCTKGFFHIDDGIFLFDKRCRKQASIRWNAFLTFLKTDEGEAFLKKTPQWTISYVYDQYKNYLADKEKNNVSIR